MIDIVFNSDKYGEMLFVDEITTMKKYKDVDILWPEKPSVRVNMKPILKNYTDYFYIWGIDYKNMESISVNGFHCFPNHIEKELGYGTYVNVPRVIDKYINDYKADVYSCISRYLFWELYNKPRTYVYAFFNDNDSLSLCAKQAGEKLKLTSGTVKKLTVHKNYDNTGINLTLFECFPDLKYKYLIDNNFIDERLSNEINTFLKNKI